MEQILGLINKECHYSGNQYQCKWKMQHFAGIHVREYCYNYGIFFKICRSCKEYSNSLSSMISRKSLVLAVLTRQEAEIKKLEKKLEKLSGEKRHAKRVQVPDIIQEYMEEPDLLEIKPETSPDSPRTQYTEQYTDPQDDCKDDQDYIVPEKTRLLPQSVKFREEIELYKLRDD